MTIPQTTRFIPVLDRYLLQMLLTALVLSVVALTVLVLLTQSIKYLELVMNAGASSMNYFKLLSLAIPKFVEAVLPVSLFISVLFVYNRMISDSEMVVMRSAGCSPFRLAKPVLWLAIIMGLFMFFLAGWGTPAAVATLQTKRSDIQSEYAKLLFREGVFNTVGSGLTAYVRNRERDGSMSGMMIHDTRAVKEGGNPYTIIARSGVANVTEDGQRIVVYDGTRQELDKETGNVSRLSFKKYTVDIPQEVSEGMQRWQEPDERSLNALFAKETFTYREIKRLDQFRSEINRRLSLPFLTMAMPMIAALYLLVGPLSRRGSGRRLAFATLNAFMLQGLYLLFFNLSKASVLGIVGMYAVGIIPLVSVLFVLSSHGEEWRHRYVLKRVRG